MKVLKILIYIEILIIFLVLSYLFGFFVGEKSNNLTREPIFKCYEEDTGILRDMLYKSYDL